MLKMEKIRDEKIAIRPKALYSRICNRLKARKRRGRITTDEWNRQVVQAQDLKDAFLAKQITQQEYVRKLDKL